MTEQIRVELFDHQIEFLFSEKKICALIGGIGSGKTFIGSHYALKKIQENHETTGFIGANSYSQLRDATLRTLFDEFDKLHIKYSYNEKDGFITVHSFKDARIKCASLENYNTLRGMEIGWAWLDESRDTREDAFDVVLGRLRCTKSHKLEIRITSSPSGFNWLYDRLVGKKATSDCHVIHASTYDNKSLPPDYIKTLESQYDERMLEQELQAKFVNLTSGKIYHAFDRFRHVQEFEIEGHRPKVGMDFNIENMNACIGEIRGYRIFIYDEISGLYNTFHMAQKLYEKLLRTDVDIVPDSTGKARKTSSKKSDHQILKDKNFNVIHSRNPFIEDRWNTVNKLLQEDRLIFHPRCRKLIDEMERADLENGTTDEGAHYHISVSVGYLAYKYFGLKSVRSSRNIQSRQL